jgi:hypothetical protein
MVAITSPELQQVVDHFENMVDALDRYQAELEQARLRYVAEGRDPGTYASVMANNLRRITRLRQALEGDVYDLLRSVLDGTGTLASAERGEWI